MRRSTLHAQPLFVTLGALGLYVSAARLEAQVEEGKVAKYHDFDEATGIKPEYPALTIEDLRKLTLYSKLVIKGTQVVIADDKYMRKIEPHSREKDLLIVTSDHFRFTVLKDAVFDLKRLGGAGPGGTFLWIPHATRESPDGKPYLKDLVLLAYNKKTRKLLQPWPFRRSLLPSSIEDSDGNERPVFSAAFSLQAADPRPLQAKLPREEKSVAGTFHSGNADYLVLDVFGGYSIWGKVASYEFLPLRGAEAAALDAFHKAPAKGGRPWANTQWKNPRIQHQHELLAVDPQALARLKAKLPAVLETKIRTEKTEGWEDLLLLDQENLPVKQLDDLLKDVQTFGDLVAWAGTYSENRWNSGFFLREWFGPLEEQLRENDRSHIVNARVLRYAFRRMGIPARLHGVCERQPLYPQLLLEVFIPSQGVSWFFVSSYRSHIICEPGSPALFTLPTMTFTFQGKIPLFDIHLGGGKNMGRPSIKG